VNTASDQLAVGDEALAQIPQAHVGEIEIQLRADSTGTTHELTDWCGDDDDRLTIGYDQTAPVRDAILKVPANAWGFGARGGPRARTTRPAS
jgi:hypothetical protein